MPVSSSTEHWIRPDALKINLNHFGDPDYLQVSLLAGAVVMAFKQDVISYNAAHNYRTWPLQAANTYLETSSAYHVYARLTRSEVNASALVVYDPVLRDIEGRSITIKESEKEKVQSRAISDEETDEEESPDMPEGSTPSDPSNPNKPEQGDTEILGEPDPNYFYVYLGKISASVDEYGYTNLRTWEAEFRAGSLNTNQFQNEEGLGEWSKMFKWNKVTDLIEVLKIFSSAIFKKFSIKKGDEEKIITDIKRTVDSDTEFMVDEDGKILYDDLGNPIPNPDYVPVSDETLPTTAWVVKNTDGKYLRKDKDDRSKGTVASDKGFEIGDFIPGMISGSGAKVYKDENEKTILEVDKIYGREELLVPKISFNTIEVVSSETAQTFAYGTIKSVDTERQIATLDLLEDEYGKLREDDICRGLFHFLGGSNSSSDDEDANGFKNYSGYSSSYFYPSQILVDEMGHMEFRYVLQSEDGVHPCAGMKFYAYGNFGIKERQSILVQTREYTRMLANVSTWKIQEHNIMMQTGNLDGLNIGGQPMKGYSSFQKNVYITGSVIHFDEQQKEEIKGDSAYNVSLSSYMGVIRINDKGEITEERYTEQGVDGEYYLKTTIHAVKGGEQLAYSEDLQKGTFAAYIRPVGCMAQLVNGTVFIMDISENVNHAYVEISVSCEGNASFEHTYDIKLTKDGVSGFDSLVFTRTNDILSTPPVGGTYQNPIPDEVLSGRKWNDGVPEGTEQVWMSKCHFVSNGKYPEDAQWTIPTPMTDTADFEVIYHDGFSDPNQEPVPPTNRPNGADKWQPDNGWTDDATVNSEWMATSVCKNGVWGDWKVARMKGEDGSFTSFVFTRTNEKPSAPVGGDYYHPMPDEVLSGRKWYDGVPEGTEQVWMSQYKFVHSGDYSEQEGVVWSDPVSLTDTADIEIIYSEELEKPDAPKGKPGDVNWVIPEPWTDDPTVDSIWMAISKMKNGIWGDWHISKIKGESGDSPLRLIIPYTSISTNSLGSYSPSSVLIRAMRGSVPEKVWIAAFGFADEGGDGEGMVRLDMDNGNNTSFGNLWDFDLNGISKYKFNRLVFRAYIHGLPSEDTWEQDYNVPYDAETGLNFVKNGNAGPMPRNCGEYNSATPYAYDENFRDFVWYKPAGQAAQVYMRKSRGETIGSVEGSIIGIDPDGVSGELYWENVPKTAMTAIDTALIDNANIAGFIFANGWMVSQENGREETISNPEESALILKGDTGEIVANKGTFRGTINALKGSIGGFEISDSTLVGSTEIVYIDNPEVTGHQDVILSPSGLALESRTMTGGVKSAVVNVVERDDYALYISTINRSGVYVGSSAVGINVVEALHVDGATNIVGDLFVTGRINVDGVDMKIVVDENLDETSANPIQNKAVASALKEMEQKLGSKIVKVSSLPSDPDPNVLYIL